MCLCVRCSLRPGGGVCAFTLYPADPVALAGAACACCPLGAAAAAAALPPPWRPAIAVFSAAPRRRCLVCRRCSPFLLVVCATSLVEVSASFAGTRHRAYWPLSWPIRLRGWPRSRPPLCTTGSPLFGRGGRHPLPWPLAAVRARGAQLHGRPAVRRRGGPRPPRTRLACHQRRQLSRPGHLL